MPKQAEVRFYFDEDLLGSAKIIAALRPDCTYPGDPGATIHRRHRSACPIAKGTKDTVWLPTVAKAGWVIVTRDLNIRSTPAELRAVKEHGARMVALADANNNWAQLELFMQRWRRIEELCTLPGPFIYQASRSRFRELDLAAA